MTIETPHALNKVQCQVYDDPSRIILYSGGYGCGKTLMGCYWVLKKLQRPFSIGTIFSPTSKMLFDNIINPYLLPLLDDTIGKDNYRFWKANIDLRILVRNGTEIRLRAFDDESKLRGADLGWVWLDEAIGRDRVYLTKDRFNQIRARLRRGEDQQMLITTNPGGQTHFLYKYFVEENQDSKNRSVHFGTIYDNKHLGADYIRDMEATYTQTELMGRWERNIGVVYDEFDPVEHVKDFDIDYKNWEFFIAVDYGYNHPFVCLLISRDSDYNYYVIDEIYKTNMLIRELAPIIKEKFIDPYEVERMISDNARPELRQELEMLLEIPSYFAPHNEKRVYPGIQAVKKKLRKKRTGEPSLLIAPTCINLIKEFQTYVWKVDKDGDRGEEPEKKDDDGLDALRYLIFSFEKYEFKD